MLCQQATSWLLQQHLLPVLIGEFDSPLLLSITTHAHTTPCPRIQKVEKQEPKCPMVLPPTSLAILAYPLYNQASTAEQMGEHQPFLMV